MGISVNIKEAVVKNEILTLNIETLCEMRRPSARLPRIEVVFDNGWDNRRMVMICHSFRPQADDPSKTFWIAGAKYTFLLRHLFAYGSWEKCRMTIDISYDGVFYKSVPLKTDRNPMPCDPVNPADVLKDEQAHAKTNEKKDRMEFADNYADIILGVPIEVNPPVQPNMFQILLGILVRTVNVLLGFLCLPWYFIDVLGIIFLPTERKDKNLRKLGLKGKIFHYMAWRFFSFCRFPGGKSQVMIDILKISYQFSNAFHHHKKSILFLSNRRDDMSGNFEYVYEYLKGPMGKRCEFWLSSRSFQDLGLRSIIDLAWKCGKARVLLLDDYTPYVRMVCISEDTKIMQLWHACGAFKSFGYSRLGKKGGGEQVMRVHRDYNYCFVSSSNIARFYAEGFGIAVEKVLPYGVPRTDMFFDQEIRSEKENDLYTSIPLLKGKKVILFAPTFRGEKKTNAYYSLRHFEPNAVMNRLPEEYVLIIKHHPFVHIDYSIEKKNRNRIFDLSGQSEINDLLFITDVLITDYSSVIYEASLLNIPMLFYAYDLEDYISSRDFYFEYEINVPGKIVYTQEELVEALLNHDFEHEKVEEFCKNNFDQRDGQASRRIADFIMEIASE